MKENRKLWLILTIVGFVLGSPLLLFAVGAFIKMCADGLKGIAEQVFLIVGLVFVVGLGFLALGIVSLVKVKKIGK